MNSSAVVTNYFSVIPSPPLSDIEQVDHHAAAPSMVHLPDPTCLRAFQVSRRGRAAGGLRAVVGRRAGHRRHDAPLRRIDGAGVCPQLRPAGRARGIYFPEALNRAFAPSGFLQSFDLRPELAAIRAPTLVIAGQHDCICPPEFSEKIHRLIPGSQLHIFDDSSHSIRVDEPARLLRGIGDSMAA
jgi:pimeloyl-ACP methyl ester carboxylesterase